MGGGGSALNFQRGKAAKSFLEYDQAGVSVHADERADGLCSKLYFEEVSKLNDLIEYQNLAFQLKWLICLAKSCFFFVMACLTDL